MKTKKVKKKILDLEKKNGNKKKKDLEMMETPVQEREIKWMKSVIEVVNQSLVDENHQLQEKLQILQFDEKESKRTMSLSKRHWINRSPWMESKRQRRWSGCYLTLKRWWESFTRRERRRSGLSLMLDNFDQALHNVSLAFFLFRLEHFELFLKLMILINEKLIDHDE